MQDALNLKNIEDIISSYETRIESISSIFDTTHLIFSDFQESTINTKEEREKINIQLRDILAKNEHLRRKDFDNMMQGLLQAQDQRGKDVRNLLRIYFNDQKTMAQALRENLGKFKENLAKGEAERVKEFQGAIKEIFSKQEKRKNEVTSRLKEFQDQQQEIAKRLKELLAKGRELRIKDLKAMLRDFQSQRERRFVVRRKRKEEATKRRAEVAKMLGSFKKARQQFRPLSEAIHPHTKNFGVGVNIDAQNEQKV